MPVTLKRFLAPDLVLILGIWLSLMQWRAPANLPRAEVRGRRRSLTIAC